MTDYQISAYDLDGGLVLSDWPTTGPFSYGEVLNSPGSSTIVSDMQAPGVTRENLEPAERSVRVFRNGNPVWGGWLWQADVDWTSEVVTFTSEGYYSRLRRWYPLDDLFFVNVDQFHIVRDLIDYVQTGDVPGGGTAQYSQDLGITVITQSNSGVTRKRHWCCPPTDTIADIIDDLAEHHNGFDFEINAENEMRMWHPRRGSDNGVHFYYSKNPDEVSNVWSMTDHSYDGHDTTTLLIGIGPEGTCSECADLTLVEPSGGAHMFEKRILMDILDMSHIHDRDSRERRALEHLRIHKHNRRQVTITTPLLPFGNYNVGDIVHITSPQGYVVWQNRWMRILSWTVTVDGGTETAELLLDSQVDEN